MLFTCERLTFIQCIVNNPLVFIDLLTVPKEALDNLIYGLRFNSPNQKESALFSIVYV